MSACGNPAMTFPIARKEIILLVDRKAASYKVETRIRVVANKGDDLPVAQTDWRSVYTWCRNAILI